jgi:hypothetical protein
MQRSVTWRLIASTDAEVEAADDAFGWQDRSSAGTCAARNGIAGDPGPVLAGGLGIRVRIPPRFQGRERNLGGASAHHDLYDGEPDRSRRSVPTPPERRVRGRSRNRRPNTQRRIPVARGTQARTASATSRTVQQGPSRIDRPRFLARRRARRHPSAAGSARRVDDVAATSLYGSGFAVRHGGMATVPPQKADGSRGRVLARTRRLRRRQLGRGPDPAGSNVERHPRDDRPHLIPRAQRNEIGTSCRAHKERRAALRSAPGAPVVVVGDERRDRRSAPEGGRPRHILAAPGEVAQMTTGPGGIGHRANWHRSVGNAHPGSVRIRGVVRHQMLLRSPECPLGQEATRGRSPTREDSYVGTPSTGACRSSAAPTRATPPTASGEHHPM